MGRFINADAYTSTGQGLLGNNMFAYCGNNPVNRVDYTGARYCEGTSIINESSYDRFISCDFQRIVALQKLGQIVDLTDVLNEFMNQNLEKLRQYKETYGWARTCIYFYNNVGAGKELDIKLKDEWQFENGKTYMYKGRVLRYDDPGNINFGYLGAELFCQTILCAGAGINQISKPNVPHGDIFSFFDDPRDNFMIKYGYGLYKGWY